MIVTSRWSSFTLRCLLAAVVAAGCCAALAQTAPKGEDKTGAAKAPAAEPKPEPVAIPAADAPRRAEEASNLLGDLREEALDDRTAQEVERELRALTREIDARLAENRKA